jgi:hypothetical protein
MSKTKQTSGTIQSDSKNASGYNDAKSDKGEFKAYDDAVKKGPPLDPGVVTTIGGRRMGDELEEHHSVSPRLSGGDVDAAWQEAEAGGDEAVGGSVATPDQDVVDEIGRAVGLEFQDNEELRAPAEVLEKRDRHRWELDRRSADDTDPSNQE